MSGLVLLAHAPEGGNTWETFDQKKALGLGVNVAARAADGVGKAAGTAAEGWEGAEAREDEGDGGEYAYAHVTFPRVGPLNSKAGGLTVAGSSLQYGETELFEQDASILGWTCGNGKIPLWIRRRGGGMKRERKRETR